MYALSRRRDLPLFSSLFRAKIRTRILSTTFGAIFVSNRRPVNLTKKVNLLSHQSILFLFPDSLSPRGFRHLLLLSPLPSVPSLPHHSAPTSARRKPLASHLAPSRHNAMGSLLGSRRELRSPTDTQRAPTKTPPSSLKKENSREFKPNFTQRRFVSAK